MPITNWIKKLYLLLFLLTPLIFTSATSELFEFPKILLIYAATTLLVSLHLINHFWHGAPLRRPTFLDIPILLFLLSQILSTIFSIDSHTSFFGYYSRFNGGLLSTLCFILLYFILVNYLDDIFVNKIIKVSLLTGLLVSLYAIAEHFGASISCLILDGQFTTTCWIQDVQSRVFATLGQPNWLAAYLCILLPFSLHKSLKSPIYYLLTPIYFLAILFTKSQSGIAAALISTAIYFFFLFINQKNYLLPIIGYILLFTVLTLTITNPLKDKLFHTTTSYSPVPNPTINITPSGNIRKIVWQGAIDLGLKYPLLGTGVETFAYSYYWVRPAAHNLTSEWDFLYNKAHNEYLNYFATTGFFGLGSYLLLIVSILLFTRKNPIVFAAFLSILITNFFGFSVVTTSLYFFLLSALILPPSAPLPPKGQHRLATIPIVVLAIYCLLFIISYYQADKLYSAADQKDNLDAIKLALKFRPHEATYLAKFSSLAAQNGLTDEAISASNQALNLSPFNINYWKERAQMYYYLTANDPQNFLRAISAIQKATQLAPTDAKSFYVLANFWRVAQQTDEAIYTYQQAIKLKPNYDYAYFALGEIYFANKDLPNAKSAFTKVLEIAPNNVEAKKYLDKL